MTAEPSAPKSSWRDLRPRVLSAVVLVAIGIGAIWAGHGAFRLLVWVTALIAAWELARMTMLKRAAFGLNGGDITALVLYALLVLMGLKGLLDLSYQAGRGYLIYAIALVATSDTMGYFVGKSIGGPKFWPRISPKKTWAGTIGGWVGVGILAAIAFPFMPPLVTSHVVFVVGSVLAALASQMGDIAESGLKRRMGVKDSSNIIPGHGGVLDRFDALLAVGALYFFLSLFFG